MGFLDDWSTTRDPAPPVRQQHNVSTRGSHGGGKEHVSNAQHLLILLGSLPQLKQIHANDLQDVGGGGGAMLDYSGHTTRVSSHQIPWNAAIRWTGFDTRLEEGDREKGAIA